MGKDYIRKNNRKKTKIRNNGRDITKHLLRMKYDLWTGLGDTCVLFQLPENRRIAESKYKTCLGNFSTTRKTHRE